MPSPKSIVSVEPVAGNLAGAVGRALDAAEWTRFVPKAADVALKVNLGCDLFVPGAITSPFFVEAVIARIRPHVGRILLVESDQVLEDVELAFRRSGMADVCRRTGVPWINLGRKEVDWVEAPENVVLKRVAVPRVLRDMLLVTLPVMKTHAKTVITGSLKNQWGCLPKMRHEYHLVLDDAIPDLNAVLQPRFAIMDATIGMEGNGPKSGRSRIVDRVLASGDLVALDAVQAASMGIDPGLVPHLVTSAERRLGTRDLAQIEIRGLHPAEHALPFQPARHNPVSVVETLLRKSRFKRLFFDTALFRVCLWSAKSYYRVWNRFNAARSWQAVLAHPYYGPLWRSARLTASAE